MCIRDSGSSARLSQQQGLRQTPPGPAGTFRDPGCFAALCCAPRPGFSMVPGPARAGQGLVEVKAALFLENSPVSVHFKSASPGGRSRNKQRGGGSHGPRPEPLPYPHRPWRTSCRSQPRHRIAMGQSPIWDSARYRVRWACLVRLWANVWFRSSAPSLASRVLLKIEPP